VIHSYTPEPHLRLHAAPLAAALAATEIRNPASLPDSAWLIVASRRTARHAPAANVILIEHGAGQMYQHDAGGVPYTHDNVRLFIAPRQQVADRGAVLFPNAERIVASPYLEHLPRPGGGLVTYTTHSNAATAPESRSTWDHYQWALRSLVDAHPTQFHSHPRMINLVQPRAQHLSRPYEPDWPTALAGSSALVVDNSSVMWEACAVGLPIVICNAPWYRRDVEWGMRFWEYSDAGPQVDHPGELVAAVDAVLRHDEWGKRRAEVAGLIYERVTGSTVRAVEAVLSLMRHGSVILSPP
jgi:hypothetical protein